MSKITTEVAYRIRTERGLALPTNKEYEDPRVAVIARLQAKLQHQIDILDGELETKFYNLQRCGVCGEIMETNHPQADVYHMACLEKQFRSKNV